MRTSHYPQSHYFIDECDRRGLLVFTEIPGWQHIGDEKWIDRAVENVREMVCQYRNHPSIVLWGVRINESQDNDAFYTRTNALAHELDPSRPTSGVRYLEKSSLLEDVYAFNDFSHKGNNPGCKETLQDGRTGFIYEGGNVAQLCACIERFLKMKNKDRQRMGVRGREYVEANFSRTIVIDAYLKKIAEILDK